MVRAVVYSDIPFGGQRGEFAWRSPDDPENVYRKSPAAARGVVMKRTLFGTIAAVAVAAALSASGTL
jgi:hypothetical protein